MLHAEYHDGFTERLLAWRLDARDGTAHVRAAWFAYDKPDRRRRAECIFLFDDESIRIAFSTIESLQEVYSSSYDDCESCELQIEIGGRRIRRYVYGGFDVRRRGVGPLIGRYRRPPTFSEADAADIETFLSVWGPIERDVMIHVGLPGYRPWGLVRVGHGIRMPHKGVDVPCHIWINHDDERFPIVLGEGVGENFVACSVTAQELLADKWSYIVAACRCEWLVAEIRRLAEAEAEIGATVLEDQWRKRCRQ